MILLNCVTFVSLSSVGCKTVEPVGAKSADARVGSTLSSVPLHIASPLVAIGQVSGYNTVVVKSRVDGPLLQIAFREGQSVAEGDLLAVVDPTTFRIALDEASATRDKDVAELDEAKATFLRTKALFEAGIIARQDFEKQEATFHQMEGAVRADQAAVDRASLDMSCTKILAPVSGRVGFKMVDVGNIVHASDSAGIVTITQVQPIVVVFSVPPDRLNEIVKYMHRQTVHIEAFNADGKSSLGKGEVLAVDPVIDSSTGSAKLKAVFPNVDQLLWPNEFVQVELRLDAIR